MVTLQKRLLVVVLALSPLVAQERIITSTELKANANGSSCWIQIDNYVYDITPYLSEHATTHEYALVKWCGKDATSGWKDKDGKNKSHSRKAATLLRKYRIGAMR